ncbi:ABC transporter ATP-binding protein [Brevibacterium daeguense]|uniref:ABC transporter ATP-binding protein n=1 Tax=Brevibacterium daeguense TaxID=909936 RepID=UPI001EFF8D99
MPASEQAPAAEQASAAKQAPPSEQASAADLRVFAEVPERDVAADLTVPAGTILGLVGPNGVGKSTVLQVISGLLIPAAGEVSVGARILTRVPRDAGARRVFVPPHRRGVSQLLQDPALFPSMTARDNVAFGLRAAGLRKAAARDRASELLADMGIAQLADRKPHQMSGGQQARTAIARAVAAGPDVILLDEPFAAVDAEAVAEFRETVRRALAGHTVVLVSHQAGDLWALCDHIAVMSRGRIAQTGSVDAVLGDPSSQFVRRLLG